MKKILIAALGLGLIAGIGTAEYYKNDIIESYNQYTETPARYVFDKTKRGIVFIANPQPKGTGTGTGFIIGENLIVTNYHVVKDNVILKIEAHGSEKNYEGRVIASSEDHDIALVELNHWDVFQREQNPTILKLADKNTYRVGDKAVVIGHPWGLKWSVSEGVISGEQRIIKQPIMFLQVDAKVYQGNSGGPMLNNKGEVIGMNTLMFSNEGGSYGFSIPVEYIHKVVYDLLKYKKSQVAYMGIKMDLTPDENRVIVKELKSDGSAEKCGVKPNDVLIDIITVNKDDKPVKTFFDVLQKILLLNMDEKAVEFDIERNGSKLKIKCDLTYRDWKEWNANKE